MSQRVAKRLNVSAPDADVTEIEQDLMAKIPKKIGLSRIIV